MKNLNEQIERIKQLFTEERLYGNLVDLEIISEGGYKALANLGSFSKGSSEILVSIKPGNLLDISEYLAKNADVWAKHSGYSLEQLDRMNEMIRNIDDGIMTPYTLIATGSGKKVPLKDTITREGYLRNNVIDAYNKKFGEDLPMDNMPDSYKVVDDVKITKTTDEIYDIIEGLRKTLKPGEMLVTDIEGTKYTLKGLDKIMESNEIKNLPPDVIKKMRVFLNNNFNFLESSAAIKAHIEKNKSGLNKLIGPRVQRTNRIIKVGGIMHLLSLLTTDYISPLMWAGVLAGFVSKMGVNFNKIFSPAACKGIEVGFDVTCDQIRENVKQSVINTYLALLNDDNGLNCKEIDRYTHDQILSEIEKSVKEEFGSPVLTWVLETLGGDLTSLVGADDVEGFRRDLKSKCKKQAELAAATKAVDLKSGDGDTEDGGDTEDADDYYGTVD